MSFRVVALVAAYNEERFLPSCLEHLLEQGVDVHVIDNGSKDATGAIVRRFAGPRVTLEDLPRDGTYRWERILMHKERRAAEIEADWFLNVDADEIHLPPGGRGTLAEALVAADAGGYTAAESLEFTFLPTAECPEHDHARYRETMLWYYPFAPGPLHLVRAWKKPAVGRVEFAWSGGHRLRLPLLHIAPERFLMKHYLCLGREHFAGRYLQRVFDANELARGWHGWRSRFHPELIAFPPEGDLRRHLGDDRLDPCHPRTRHWFDQVLLGSGGPGPGQGG